MSYGFSDILSYRQDQEFNDLVATGKKVQTGTEQWKQNDWLVL